MITEVTFVQMVCIGGTNTRETRFRSDDGWSIGINGEAVSLSHKSNWRPFEVRGVGFTYVETPDVAKKGKAK